MKQAGEHKQEAGFGRRIAELRQAAGLTMTELAERAGVSEAYISMLESGGRRPSRKLIEKLARVLENESAPLLRDQLLVLAHHDPLSEAKKPSNSAYEKLLQQAPPDQFSTFIALVNSLIRQGQFALAQERIEGGFRHFQQTAQLQMLIAYLELSRGHHDAGIVAMEAAIRAKRLQPEQEAVSLAELQLNLGVLHFFKGSSRLAALHAALPGSDARRSARAEAIACFGRARTAFAAGLACEPGHLSLCDEYARVCFNLADLASGRKASELWQEAIDAFLRVLEAPDKQPLAEDDLLESSCFLAHAYTKAGETDRARYSLLLITACQPRYAFAHYVLACHHALAGAADGPERALEALARAIGLSPGLRGQARLEPDFERVRREQPARWEALLA